MEKFKSSIGDFWKKHTTKIIIVFVLFNTVGSVWNPAKDVMGYMFSDNVASIVEHIINQSVKEQIERGKVDFSLKLMQLETKDIRTPYKIDQKVKYWKRNKWTAQLVALSTVIHSGYAKEKLKECMYNEQVFKALLSHE